MLLALILPFGIDAFLAVAAEKSPTPTIEQLQGAIPSQKDTGWILEYIVFTMNPEEQEALARFESRFQLTAAEKQSLTDIAKTRSDGEVPYAGGRRRPRRRL